MNKYRIFRVATNETLIYIEAEDIIEASSKTGKIYGPDNDTVDLEEIEQEA